MEKSNIKKERIEVMMDMETTDLAETSAILEIAIVPFHLEGLPTGEAYFHEYIDLTSCFLEGMTFNRKTQEVWMDWNTQAKYNLQTAEKTTIRSAIRDSFDYLNYLHEKYELHIWCRGKNFDLPKYEYCVRTLLEKEVMPYHFYHTEDARDYAHTFNVHSSDVEFKGNQHCALDDCFHQIKQVQMAYMRKCFRDDYAKSYLVEHYRDNTDKFRTKYQEAFGESLSEEQLKELLA